MYSTDLEYDPWWSTNGTIWYQYTCTNCGTMVIAKTLHHNLVTHKALHSRGIQLVL